MKLKVKNTGMELEVSPGTVLYNRVIQYPAEYEILEDAKVVEVPTESPIEDTKKLDEPKKIKKEVF